MTLYNNTFIATGTPRYNGSTWWISGKKSEKSDKFLFVYQTHDINLAKGIRAGDVLSVLAVEVSRKEVKKDGATRLTIVWCHILEVKEHNKQNRKQGSHHEEIVKLRHLNFDAKVSLGNLAYALGLGQGAIKNALDGKTKRFASRATTHRLWNLYADRKVFNYKVLN